MSRGRHTLETQIRTLRGRVEKTEQTRLIKATGWRGCVGNLLEAVVGTNSSLGEPASGRGIRYCDRLLQTWMGFQRQFGEGREGQFLRTR